MTYLEQLIPIIKENYTKAALVDYSPSNSVPCNAYTFDQMYQKICALKTMLSRMGVVAGDHVALCGSNSAHWMISYLSVASIRAVNVCLMHSQTPEMLASQIDFSDAKVLFVDSAIWSCLQTHQLDKVHIVVSMDDWSILRGATGQCLLVEDASCTRENLSLDAIPDVDVNAPAQLCFTSSTSGNPKCVVASWKNITANMLHVADYYTASAISQYLYTVGLLQDVAEQINTTNQQIGRIPIADVNMLIHDVIDEQDAPFIYERMGQHLYHYMIDEFQDTSSLQWQNFYPLISEAESKGSDNLIVGDVKQSIYRWRNSDWRLLNQVDQSFGDTCMPKMDCNWRTAELLVQHNEQLMLQYSQWITQQIQEKGWDDHAEATAIEHIYAQDAIHQKAKRDYPGVVHMQFFEGKKDEVQTQTLEVVAQQLQQLKEEDIDLGRVAILVRKRNEAEMTAQYLIEQGFTVQSTDGMRIQSHPAVQLLVAIMQQRQDQQRGITNEVTNAIIRELHAPFTEEEMLQMNQAANLPVYEYVQTLIQMLQLQDADGALPYLTAFQDQIYQFTQSRVANTQSFLEYWERKKDKAAIPAPAETNAIRVLTIHSSKGLEFDIVMLPFMSWELQSSHNDEILWCQPTSAPFNEMPIVAVSISEKLLQTHFRNEYIQEIISKYIDNLNLTYVALTRPKYRLYAYGPRFEKEENPQSNIKTVGQLFSYILYQQTERNEEGEEVSLLQQLEDGSWAYHKQDPNPTIAPEEPNNENNRQATYVSSPINGRLTLRSRAEDDFNEDTPLETIDLGILMHEWLADITTWTDAQPALEKMRITGRITAQQEQQMQTQWLQMQNLLQHENRNYWFDGSMKVLTEQTILSTNGKTYRPDRIIIHQKHAEVIDYKFGEEHTSKYNEQLRNYTLMLKQMGYTVDAYVVYVALQKIVKVH
mgnify:CR=1 FL=1